MPLSPALNEVQVKYSEEGEMGAKNLDYRLRYQRVSHSQNQKGLGQGYESDQSNAVIHPKNKAVNLGQEGAGDKSKK